jgi:hypothetical protein
LNCLGEHFSRFCWKAQDRFAVGKDDEAAHFQHVAEMLYSIVDGQQLAVVCTVFLLSQVEFLREESEGLSGFLDALL